MKTISSVYCVPMTRCLVVWFEPLKALDDPPLAIVVEVYRGVAAIASAELRTVIQTCWIAYYVYLSPLFSPPFVFAAPVFFRCFSSKLRALSRCGRGTS